MGTARGCWRGYGSSLDRLVGLPLAFNRRERCIAQFAQDVVGAPAEFARDREAGAVVVDPSGRTLVREVAR